MRRRCATDDRIQSHQRLALVSLPSVSSESDQSGGLAGSVEYRRIRDNALPTWHDKAGNATNFTDGDLSFPNLNSGVDPNPKGTSVNPADDFQTNLIMPEPTFFLNAKLGQVSIIRPTSTAQGGTVASVVSFADDGLFSTQVQTRTPGSWTC
jgi:hypothetical protein